MNSNLSERLVDGLIGGNESNQTKQEEKVENEADEIVCPPKLKIVKRKV